MSPSLSLARYSVKRDYFGPVYAAGAAAGIDANFERACTFLYIVFYTNSAQSDVESFWLRCINRAPLSETEAMHAAGERHRG